MHKIIISQYYIDYDFSKTEHINKDLDQLIIHHLYEFINNN